MVNRITDAQESNVNPRPNTDRSSTTLRSKAAVANSDEIIGSLANNYENRRARQVTEWERVQQSNIQRAATAGK